MPRDHMQALVDRVRLRETRRVLAASDREVGPACMKVEVPPTIAMDHDFREAYEQGYRHALADARAALALGEEDAS